MTSLLLVSFWWEEENLVATEQQEGLVHPTILREYLNPGERREKDVSH